MEKEIPEPAKPAFKLAWTTILSLKVQHLSIHQVLCFLYMLVAFYHPAFQFATPAMQDTLLTAYSDGSAVKLIRDHTDECTVHCIMRKLFNLKSKPPTTKHGIETLVEYTHSFVDALLSHTFPFLSYKSISFPYLSSLVTLGDIDEERKQTLPDELPLGEIVRHNLSEMDIQDLFESPSASEDVFDVDFPESGDVEQTIAPSSYSQSDTPVAAVDSQSDTPVAAVASGSEPQSEMPSADSTESNQVSSEAQLGKKSKKCAHRSGYVRTIDLKNGKVKEVCKKCYEKGM
jgi:hypothetical protein